MGYFKKLRTVAGLLCLVVALQACAAVTTTSTSSTGTTVEDTTSIESQLSGTVLIPATILSAGLHIASEISESPLTGATVAAYNPVTGERISEIPSTSTDSDGRYTLDLSSYKTLHRVTPLPTLLKYE